MHTTSFLTVVPLVLVSLAGCASTSGASNQSPGTATQSAQNAAPQRMTGDEFRRALSDGRFRTVELSPEGEGSEVLAGDPEGSSAPGTISVIDCMPGGTHTTFVEEVSTHRLLRVRESGGFHAPDGVHVPTTRCYRRAYRLPQGTSIAGNVDVDYSGSSH